MDYSSERYPGGCEPDIYPSREEWGAYVAREQILRAKAEEERCTELRDKMEEAICRRFSGEELIKIQPYKEAIFGYLKNNAEYGIENIPATLGNYIEIYYKDLTGKQVTTSEYGFVQLNSRTINNTITSKLISRYFHCDYILEMVSIDIGMSKEEIIALIEIDNVDESQSKLDIFKDKVSKLLTLKANNDPLSISASEFITAITTIKQLRGNPKMMGLTYDEIRLRTEKRLPPLKRR